MKTDDFEYKYEKLVPLSDELLSKYDDEELSQIIEQLFNEKLNERIRKDLEKIAKGNFKDESNSSN